MAKVEIKESSQEIISWRAAEYEHTEKEAGWYWLVGAISFVLIVVAFWQKNFFFAVFIVIAVGMVMFFSRRKPEVVDFSITDTGINIGELSLYFENLDSFSIRSRPGHLDEIVLKKKTTVNPFVRIPIDSRMVEKAGEFLRNHLPEVEYKESLVDIFSEWFGF
jgi:hypothetical protein